MSLRKGNTLIGGAGTDGYSPSASVSKVGNTATITITDKNGTTTASVSDGGQTIQYETMPTASADNLGQIVQYTGTTGTYTNGYFYECTTDGSTYSWTALSVQPASKGWGVYYYTSDTVTLDEMDLGLYLIDYKSSIKVRGTSSQEFYTLWSLGNGKAYFYIVKKYSQAENWDDVLITDDSRPQISGGAWVFEKINVSKNTSHPTGLYISRNNISIYMVDTQYSQTISGIKTFTSTPRTNGVLDTNNDLTPKWYVDKYLYTQSGLTEFSSESTYAVGDYVFYEGTIYKCTTAVSTAGDWDSTKWTSKTYMEYMYDALVGTALGGSY